MINLILARVSKISIRTSMLILFLAFMLILNLFAPERSEQIKVTSSYPATLMGVVKN
jgi:hypothetical protein